MSGSIVTLNIGGHIYTTTLSTLTRYPDSMLGAMFGKGLGTLQDDQGRYFIDRNGRLFEHVLNFLRTSQLVLPEDFKELPLLEMEADFYQIQPLIESVKSYKDRMDQRCVQDVVSFTVRPVVSRSNPLFVIVGANTKEVEDKVDDMLQSQTSHFFQKYIASANAASLPVKHETLVAMLLGKLHEIGFTVQSCVARNGIPTSWVMVRKSSRKL